MKKLLPAFFLTIACIIACGKQPLNRVPPKTEVIYTRDPCSKEENEVPDEMDTGRDQSVPPAVQPDPDESEPTAPNFPATDYGVGNGKARYAPPILGGYESPRGALDDDSPAGKE